MSNPRQKWKLKTRSVLAHYSHWCVTPPVLPSGLQVMYCPVCHTLQVYQLSTRLICEESPERTQASKHNEKPDHRESVETARHACGQCEQIAKRTMIKGRHHILNGKIQTPADADERCGRAMFQRLHIPFIRPDAAVRTDLRYHGEGYDC